jgi:hypothetical protein
VAYSAFLTKGAQMPPRLTAQDFDQELLIFCLMLPTSTAAWTGAVF